MELDEYLYANSEVTRLWLYPRGPDSGLRSIPAAEHDIPFWHHTGLSCPGDPAYIVRPLSRDEAPLPNGLPISLSTTKTMMIPAVGMAAIRY